MDSSKKINKSIELTIYNIIQDSVNPAIENHEAVCIINSIHISANGIIKITLSLLGSCDHCSSVEFTKKSINNLIDEELKKVFSNIKEINILYV